MTVDPSAKRLADEAGRAWNISSVEIDLVSVSENLVYRIESSEGDAYALRLHRPGYHTLRELESEVQWTRALEVAGIGVPAAIPTQDGRHYIEVALSEGEGIHFAGLTRWLSGKPLHEHLGDANAQARVEAYQELGRLMAAMHDQAIQWKPPSRFARHALDADGLMGDSPFWGRFWDLPRLSSAERSLLSSAREWLHSRLTDYGKSQAYSMIHADLHPANVLVVEGRPCAIDFDDAGFGWHMYDVGVALFNEYGESTYEATRDALLQGYSSRRALHEKELDRLPEFLLARTLAFVGWLNERPDVPLHRFLPEVIEVACERATAAMAMRAA